MKEGRGGGVRGLSDEKEPPGARHHGLSRKGDNRDRALFGTGNGIGWFDGIRCFD